jgi:hypothetical protein
MTIEPSVSDAEVEAAAKALYVAMRNRELNRGSLPTAMGNWENLRPEVHDMFTPDARAALVAAARARSATSLQKAQTSSAIPETEAVACKRCQGNGEIVTDWERYRSPRPGDVGDEAVAPCPDCDGTGHTHPEGTLRAALAAVDEHIRQATEKHDDLALRGKANAHLWRFMIDGLTDTRTAIEALAASPATGEREPPVTNEIEDANIVLARLAGGEHIAYSRDGESAWLSAGGREWIPETTVFELRDKGYLLRVSPPDEPFGDHDIISDAGRTALKGSQ